jgi:ribosomal peptide maturation radical SAM protein 1
MNELVTSDGIGMSQSRQLQGKRDIALVCMPWGSVLRPSLALATLKECVRSANFPVELQLLNMHFAERIGVPVYERISDFSFAPTEWFFAQHLFGPAELGEMKNSWDDLLTNEPAQDLLEHLRQSVSRSDELCARIAHIDVPWFIDHCMERVDWSKYLAVGFTTTFAQSLASVALARRIKQSCPAVNIVFGGANVDDEMGIEFLKGFPWIDYIVHGEAEQSFPMLLHQLAEGISDVDVPGVSFRRAGEAISRHDQARPLANLEESPMPDYSDYMRTAEELGWRKKVRLRLYFEGSRGCWWGAKHHCTFCGLNAGTMAFRKKSSERVYDEILHLATHYRCLSLSATDNILAMDYFSDLLPRLAACDIDLQMFFEVKANLRREQIEALRAAGISEIQPGIESLSSRILQLMRKGTTAIQNIQILKWCDEYDISPSWNLLYGFPGEKPDDYADLDRTFGLLMHLKPPNAFSPIMFERFSPYFFDHEKFGIKLEPSGVYKFLFPESRVNLSKIAYFFDGEWERTGDSNEYMAPARRAWGIWTQFWKNRSAYCYMEKGPGYLVIHDNRPQLTDGSLKPRQHTLSGKVAEIYLFCDEHRSFQAIHKMLGRVDGQPEDERQLRAWLDHLVSSRLMFREGDRYLSLAVRKRPAVRKGSAIAS